MSPAPLNLGSSSSITKALVEIPSWSRVKNTPSVLAPMPLPPSFLTCPQVPSASPHSPPLMMVAHSAKAKPPKLPFGSPFTGRALSPTRPSLNGNQITNQNMWTSISSPYPMILKSPSGRHHPTSITPPTWTSTTKVASGLLRESTTAATTDVVQVVTVLPFSKTPMVMAAATSHTPSCRKKASLPHSASLSLTTSSMSHNPPSYSSTLMSTET